MTAASSRPSPVPAHKAKRASPHAQKTKSKPHRRQLLHWPGIPSASAWHCGVWNSLTHQQRSATLYRGLAANQLLRTHPRAPR